jgi:hypothetical protein
MSEKYVTVNLYLRVHNVRAFVRAAQRRAIAEGFAKTLKEAREAGYSPRDLGACALMLLDPGESPPGCKIRAHSADVCEL